jgi:hypothetical protein
MMLSNMFLLLPVLLAVWYGEWLYALIAFGLVVFSPLFHWYRITNQKSFAYWACRRIDWIFAVIAFFFMYYYVALNIRGATAFVLYAALSSIIIFFWYGWKKGDYDKLHPWFHTIAPIVSIVILIAANQ